MHDGAGFVLDVGGENPFKLVKTPASLYSCHVEYNYDKRGDCIDLSTLDDTYYIYPLHLKNCVTKIALATEELYRHELGKASHIDPVTVLPDHPAPGVLR